MQVVELLVEQKKGLAFVSPLLYFKRFSFYFIVILMLFYI